MDRDERTADLERALRRAIEANNRSLLIALPVRVVKYNATDRPATVVVEPTVQVRVQKPNGDVVDQTLPRIPRAPVHFAGGGGFALTHPIAEGDEGHILVSSRCIEGWMERGGVQPPPHARYHDMTDAIFIPGLRSKPRALANISTDSVQLRSEDGSAFLDFKADRMRLVFPGGTEFTFLADGTFRATGNVIAGYGGGDQVGLQTHKHSDVQPGGAQSGVPVAGT